MGEHDGVLVYRAFDHVALWVARVNRVRIVRADPIILITDQFLERHGHYDRPGVSYDGDLLVVRAVNRTVIYRRREYLADQRVWVFSWPD